MTVTAMYDGFDINRVRQLAVGIGDEPLFRLRFVPVHLASDTLTVWALRDDEDFRLAVSSHTAGKRIRAIIKTEDEILGVLHEIFPKNASRFVGMTPERERTANEKLDVILDRASEQYATDVHLRYIQDGIDDVRGEVLFRIDRSLQEAPDLACDAEEMRAIINVLSNRANAPESEPLAVRGIPFKSSSQRQFDLRVQFLEDKHGRVAAIRLNGNAMRVYTLDELNMLPGVLTEVKRALMGPAGLHLLVGPQGVGKTTTLVAMALFKMQVAAARGERTNIVTAEKPIDIRINGATQIEIRDARNMSFPEAVRAFAKSDPDFMIVGEINDAESLAATMYATLLGRPCAGSIHAMHALAAFEKLFDLGAKVSTLSQTLRTILAQRMLRRLCPKCRTQRLANAEEREFFKLWEYEDTWGEPPPKEVFERGPGCDMCEGRGYFGQFPVFEFVVVTPTLIDAVREQRPLSELEQVALNQRRQYLPMSVFALAAAAQGHVSLIDAREAIFER